MSAKAAGREFEQYAEQTTIHGIKDFTLTKWKPLKVAWGVFILGALGLMCEEIYRTTKNFEEAPTAMDVKMVDMDYFPTIYFWTGDWWDDTEARRLGFDDKNLAYISKVFGVWEVYGYPPMQEYSEALLTNSTFKEEVIAEIKAKMQMHNLSTVEDMVSIVSWSFKESEYKRRYIPPAPFAGQSDGVLHTIRLKFHTGEFAYTDKRVILPKKEGKIVFGEDPYGTAYEFAPPSSLPRAFKVEVQAVNRITVLKDRGSGCNESYENSLACLHDCAVIEKNYCMYNGTTNTPTYSNKESFWQLYFDEVKMCDDNLFLQCQEKYNLCAAKCQPCTAWNYQVSVSPAVDGAGYIDINSVKKMQVSTEYYTYKMASFLGDVGGLVSLFCGASVLSFVQLIMFCCGEGFGGKRRIHDDGDQKLEEKFHQFHKKHCKACIHVTSAKI